MNRVYDAFIQKWRVIAVLMILCGIAGAVLGRALPEKVQGRAEIAFAVDTHMTGTLTDIESDRISGVMEDVIKSIPVIEAVCKTNGRCETQDFLSRARLRRSYDRWILSYRDETKNPQEIFDLMTAWVKASSVALQDAKQASLMVTQCDRTLEGLSACLSESVAIPSNPICPTDPKQLQSEFEELVSLRSEAETRALGVSPALSVAPPDLSRISVETADRPTGFYALLGVVIGLFLGAGLVLSQPKLEESSIPESDD
jgi:hypothetical protein